MTSARRTRDRPIGVPAADAGARFTEFSVGAESLARRLLGMTLVRVDEVGRCAGVIVETEAYLGVADRAAHTFGGRRTARNASMWLEGGHAYVYFTYGMHWCFNVVAGGAEVPEAVLVRALRPTEGLDRMVRRRGLTTPERLCAGPARLTQALAIDRSHDGADLCRSETIFIECGGGARRRIVVGPRIGIASAGDWAGRPLRFCLAGEERWWSKGAIAAGAQKPNPGRGGDHTAPRNPRGLAAG